MSIDPKATSDALLVGLPRTLVPQLADPVAQARAELKAALAAIEEKANVRRRIAFAFDGAISKARSFARENSGAAAGAAGLLAAAVGFAVWGAVRAFTAPGR